MSKSANKTRVTIADLSEQVQAVDRRLSEVLNSAGDGGGPDQRLTSVLPALFRTPNPPRNGARQRLVKVVQLDDLARGMLLSRAQTEGAITEAITRYLEAKRALRRIGRLRIEPSEAAQVVMAYLNHICRYRLTTRTALQRLCFSESHVNAVSKVITRLCRHGFLRRFPLYARHCYFVLGPRAIKLLGLPRSRADSLGSQALPREYATLLYCSRSGLTKERLTTDEFSVHFSGYQLDGIENSHYVVERDGAERRLSFLRVDYHGAADHVVRKCKADADTRLRSPEFSELIQSGRFMLVVATGSQEKSLAIRQALGKTTWPMGFRIHIVVIPELIHLLGR